MLLLKLIYQIFRAGAVAALLLYYPLCCQADIVSGSQEKGVSTILPGSRTELGMTSSLRLEIPKQVRDDGSSIHINSRHLTLDRNKDIATFTGEVILYFDDIVLKTDNLRVFYKKSATGKEYIEKIIIDNKLIAKKDDDTILIADYARYLPQASILVLTGNIKLQHKKYLLETTRLVYHTKLRQIKGVAN